MTDQMPAALNAELQKAAPNVYVLLEIDFPDGTVRYAKPGVHSSTNGVYQNKVIQFGSLTQKIAPRQNTLTEINCSVLISDNDSQFSNRIGKGQNIANSAARLYLASNNVPSTASWYQLFGGLLVSWRMTAARQWALSLQTPLQKLKISAPRYQNNKFDFANMDKSAVGTSRANRRVLNTVTLGNYTPLVYGNHDDFGDQNAGGIPCPLIDTVGFQNMVSLGWTNPIRVYSDNVRATTGFTITRSTINGRYYTFIDWTANHNSNTITADVEGYETVGNGTGSMICDPVSVFQHLITNFFLNDYQSGNWRSTDTTFFDSTSWTALQTALQNRAGGASYVCSRYFSNQLTGIQALNEFCQSFNLCPYWTNTGKLGIKLDNPNVAYPTIYGSTILRHEETTVIQPEYNVNDNLNRVIATFENISTGGLGTGTPSFQPIPKEYYQIEVKDPLSTAFAEEHISLTWGPSTYP